MDRDTDLNEKLRQTAREIATVESEERTLGLSVLYDLTAERLVRLAATITRHQQDSEDAVSAALVKLAARPQLLISADRPWHYVLRMVRNESLVILRSRGRWTSIGRLADRLVGRAADVVAQRDESRHIWDALSNIPGRQREVVVLKIWEQMTFAEIGEVLDITPSTAASRYRYALEKLSRHLRPHFESTRQENDVVGSGVAQ
ncbi:MAG: sigma-70 family RNA polymerase sigma factor [Planctomycetota bacterium]